MKRRALGPVVHMAVTLVALLAPGPIAARGTYQEPAEFVAEAFGGAPPPPEVLTLDEPLAQRAREILDHPIRAKRLRYWREGVRTVWVLEEVGKEEPITAGFIVNGGKIERTKVLIFRESRGWEVRYPFFTDQFHGITLEGDDELSHSIDAISGATLSVSALKKLARLALVLDRHVQAASPR